jgi:mRNA interferase MazF
MIVLVRLDPSEGSEQNKTRPAIVVSNDAANSAIARNSRGVITVVPLTSTLNTTGHTRHYQDELDPEESGLRRTSTAQAEQIRAVDALRITGVIGHVTSAAMDRVDRAIRFHLGL